MLFGLFLPRTASETMAIYSLSAVPWAGTWLFAVWQETPWPALIEVTATSKFVGRLILGVGFSHILFWFAVLARLGERVTEVQMSLLMNSIVMFMMIYVAGHWMLRPENLLSLGIATLLINPGEWFRSWLRRL
jgi:hypothetical protein